MPFPNPATQFKSGKQAVISGSKGGKAITAKKKYAAKLREMKKRGLNNKDIAWILQQLEDPNAMDMQLLDYLNDIKDDIHPSQRIAYGNLMTQVKRSIHGDKIKTENVHHIINWSDMWNECKKEENEKCQK